MTNRQAAIEIIKQLNSNGFESLLAGGCVRDMLLGRRASDYDVATAAKPEDVIRLFKRTLKIGAKFGVVIVMLKDQQVEVATFRSESGYTDGRHPGQVEFTDAAKDASRRDFTVNGMFFDPLKRKVIDYVGGQADIEKQLIRTIGSARERFGEDYLRMLRAVRFSTQLGFAIEPKAFAAIRDNAVNITSISGERIAMELEAMLVNPARSVGVSLLAESGLLDAVFPGVDDEQVQFAIGVLKQLRKRCDFALALASLFSGCQTEFALEKCEVLKLSRNQNKHIQFLLANRGKLLNEEMSLAELKMILAKPYFWDLYELQRSIQKGKGLGRKGIAALIGLKRRIKAMGDVQLQPKPLLNGHELIGLGAVHGPGLGQLAEEMYIAQLEGKLRTVEQAKRWVQKWLRKHRESEKQ